MSSEFCAVPHIDRGWRPCSSSALIPPMISTGSPMTRHVTDPGPNSPKSVLSSGWGSWPGSSCTSYRLPSHGR